MDSRNDTYAIASTILGLISLSLSIVFITTSSYTLMLLALPLSIVGLACGIIALRAGLNYTGEIVARLGIIMSIAALAIAIFYTIILMIIIFNLILIFI